MNLRLTMNGRNWNFGSNISQLLQLVAKVLSIYFEKSEKLSLMIHWNC